MNKRLIRIDSILDIPEPERSARTAALVYVGKKLKEKGFSKNVRRKVILELDFEIIMRIMNKYDCPEPGVLPEYENRTR